MTGSRRMFRGWMIGVATVIVMLSGCALIPPRPVPLVPFGDLTLTTTGGVAGTYQQLRVTAEGTVLVLSEDPSAGRIAPATLDRLRELLESERLRADVAQLQRDTGPSHCSDVFRTTLRMGDLSATQTHPCGRASTPALDELTLMARPWWQGRFDGPPIDGPDAPRIVLLEVEAAKPTGTTIELDSGRAVLVESGERGRAEELDEGSRAALRLLAAAPGCSPPRSLSDGYRVRIGGGRGEAVISRHLGPECTALSALVRIGVDAVDR